MKSGAAVLEFSRTPIIPIQDPTYVDVIIETRPGFILLIERGVAPFGWALPGGYVESCESPRDAAIREGKEETGLTISIRERFSKYQFVDALGTCIGVSTVFLAYGYGEILASDDARQAVEVSIDNLPKLIAEHAEIVADYQRFLANGSKPEQMKRLVSTKSIPSQERRAA